VNDTQPVLQTALEATEEFIEQHPDTIFGPQKGIMSMYLDAMVNTQRKRRLLDDGAYSLGVSAQQRS
jgi:hypothetical protein